jgi:hypothetical protein
MIRFGGIDLQLFTKMTDMNIDGSSFSPQTWKSPHYFHFDRGKFKGPSVPECCEGCKIYPYMTKLQFISPGRRLGRVLRAAAQLGPDATQQFAETVGFDHVVVSSHFKTQDLVNLLVFCGEHDDGKTVARFPYAPAKGETVTTGQANVEQRDIGYFGIQECKCGFGAGDGSHVKALEGPAPWTEIREWIDRLRRPGLVP